MSLKVKQLIVALLSVAIVIVLSYVIYSEKEHRLEEKKGYCQDGISWMCPVPWR